MILLCDAIYVKDDCHMMTHVALFDFGFVDDPIDFVSRYSENPKQLAAAVGVVFLSALATLSLFRERLCLILD